MRRLFRRLQAVSQTPTNPSTAWFGIAVSYFTLVGSLSLVSVVSFCSFFPSDQSVCVPSISFAQPFVQDPIQLPPKLPLVIWYCLFIDWCWCSQYYLATIVYGSSRPIGLFSASLSVHSFVQVFSIYYWSSTASAFFSASSSASLHLLSQFSTVFYRRAVSAVMSSLFVVRMRFSSHILQSVSFPCYFWHLPTSSGC